jgi:hypothetical protein
VCGSQHFPAAADGRLYNPRYEGVGEDAFIFASITDEISDRS